MSEKEDVDDVVQSLYECHRSEIDETDPVSGFRVGYRLGYVANYQRKPPCPDCEAPMVKFGLNWRCGRCRVTWIKGVALVKPKLSREEYGREPF